ANLRYLWHKDMTSYDGEEPAWAMLLQESLAVIYRHLNDLKRAVVGLANQYRYVPMLGRTHGQGAELQTFGKRCLTWLRQLEMAEQTLHRNSKDLCYSKISGAIGNYTGINPELEEVALGFLGLKPFYGATQIIPRILYVSVADALTNLTLVVGKIANDIKLGARSPTWPIYQEPFSKKQTGSSAMPHKKNTILCENTLGMTKLALGYNMSIKETTMTDEERTIEQSSVERVAWTDLFHVTARALKVMTKVLTGLKVMPDHMWHEIHATKDCYASSSAKEVLKELGRGCILAKDAYLIVQLAAFNLFEPSVDAKAWRETAPIYMNLTSCEKVTPKQLLPKSDLTLQSIISQGQLRVSLELDVSWTRVADWNKALLEIFADPDNLSCWNEIFQFSHQLRNERFLFEKILG
ncbi:lyase family protein, partial [Patescibacteria group bacterium]